MVSWRREDRGQAAGDAPATVVVRGSRFRRIAAITGLLILALLVIAIAVVWTARRPIATNILQREFEQRGVDASYELVSVGVRTQQVRNLRIGDPNHPDLTAKFAQIEIRIKWNGAVEVYRVVARGVRLRGRVINNRVTWGQVSKLLPPPSDKPFQLPSMVLDIADSSISLATPYGPLGFALEGSGNLTGGFKGRLAAASPKLVPGRCELLGMRSNFAVEVVARRPHVVGPLRAKRFACPSSRFLIDQALFHIDSKFSESFTSFDGSGRMAVKTLTAGDNGLANFAGTISFNGTPKALTGAVNFAAQRSRLGPIFADRTRIGGKYRLGASAGTFAMVGDYAANGATLAPSTLAGITGPLAAAGKTPIGPIATAIANAISRTGRNFDASGGIRMVNFPGGGAVRIADSMVQSPSGARVRVSGGDGVTYYWPSARVRIDGQIQMAGGGLPTGRIAIRQPRGGAPMSGVAEFAPYTVGRSRLGMAPIRFAAQRDGSTEVSTIAQLDGPFPEGEVRALRLPITARLGSRGGFTFGPRCVEASWAYLRMKTFQFGPTRLPVCPIGPAIITQAPGGPLVVGALLNRPVLSGRIGQSPLFAQAASARIVDKDFALTKVAARLGKSATPVKLNAERLRGTFSGSGISGTFGGADAVIGAVPILLSKADGRWRMFKGDLTVNGSAMVSDRSELPRFYPLRTNDLAFRLGDNGQIRAAGTLVHPDSGTRVTDVTIGHDLSTGVGHALLDVPGITFGAGLQPDELTRLTEGIIALVQGTVSGQGRIDWNGSGKVTSSGDFSTAGLDLAAPFGPVTGMTGTIHFDDLLGLKTPPGQTMTIASINPGILVENGVIRYQLLPNQLVKVERGEWPFMGGRLVLRETVLNFGRPSPKRLTFEVIGLDAKVFIASLGFAGIEASGKFDGVLPMIFDEEGGRIVGGRLDSRPPGGNLSYTGVVSKANLGMAGGIAFDALRDLRYKSMIIRLDGDLAGEFLGRFTIEGVALGQTTTAKIIRGLLSRIPIKLNVSIRGPFRALIATAKSFRDPRPVINDVLPVPLDQVPGITTEVRRKEEDSTMTQTPPAEEMKVTPTPPAPTER